MTVYDDSQIREVRLLIPDLDEIYGDDSDETLFTDDDITSFLDLGHGNSRWAAGLACGTVGRSELMIAKVITNYETKTDGASASKEWRAHSDDLIAQGQAEVDATGDGTDGYFSTVFLGGHAIVPEGAQRWQPEIYIPVYYPEQTQTGYGN